MADLEHSAITDPDLHEPKGIAAASAGDVYVADGAASGAMTNFATQMISEKDSDDLKGFPLYKEVTITAATLDGGGSQIIINSDSTKQYKIREIILTGAGTNFGSGGDRTIHVTDGTTVWTVIPNATIESLAAARWGDTGVPFPSTAAHMNTKSAASTDIVAKYTGGTTDHGGTGSLTLVICYERTD